MLESKILLMGIYPVTIKLFNNKESLEKYLGIAPQAACRYTNITNTLTKVIHYTFKILSLGTIIIPKRKAINIEMCFYRDALSYQIISHECTHAAIALLSNMVCSIGSILYGLPCISGEINSKIADNELFQNKVELEYGVSEGMNISPKNAIFCSNQETIAYFTGMLTEECINTLLKFNAKIN